ncbi:type II toxin-antitoxin system RelB/DinJ family antitoxin [Peribacillus sp. NPDC097675]|uniref:type II toxin-antitoxin system RelB/DinJ family antitoxin n=1 Tax=Peribacillus sp. NPDC097675 TaxID=3390618 RepID=UPI003CFCBC8B
MAQTTISVRMDEQLKKEMEYVCNELGMNLTTAITIFAKTVAREKRIPFELSLVDPFYSEENMARLQKSIAQFDEGKGTEHNLIEVD